MAVGIGEARLPFIVSGNAAMTGDEAMDGDIAAALFVLLQSRVS